MDNKMLEKLKCDLKEAVANKNIAKIEEIKRILNVSDEQTKYFSNGLTGYPSVDKVWLKHYKDGAEENARNIPENKTLWDVIEEKILEDYDIPALEYFGKFGKVFSRPDFRDLCYTWARTFRAMGVEEDEVVPIYGPFVPDACAMAFGLNMIGACPYFLKLEITPEVLAEETVEAKIAVVYDGMWAIVRDEFSKDKFKNVIVYTVTYDMPSPKKEIVSFLSAMAAKKNKSQVPDEKKYIWVDKARDIANYYSGEVKVPFVKDRRAFITSSSGTTVDGVVKGGVATNESALGQAYSALYSDIPYGKGDRILNHLPPTASTSLNSLYSLGLLSGSTIIIDPRVTAKDFYNQLTKEKPNFCINTASLWETFFNRVSSEMKKGKKFDFSYATGWMVGGEGTDTKKVKIWDEIMQECNAKRIFGGYGLTETFSGICIDRIDAEHNLSKQTAAVGVIQAGMVAATFDKDGNELTYNERGELKVQTLAQMKEYYNKPELTKKVLQDGWVCTGDIAEIDENGFLYIWGRNSDKIKLSDGSDLYLFDVANKIKEKDYIYDAIVLTMPTVENNYNLVAHIVWGEDLNEEDKKECIIELNELLKSSYPEEVVVSAYAEHKDMLPYSSTTLKKDKKNKLSKQTQGYKQVINGKTYEIKFELNNDGKYILKCAIMEKGKKLALRK